MMNNVELIKIDRNGTKHYVDHTCPRCNGAGRISYYGHVEGGICFKCGGTGRFDTTFKEYTEEYAKVLEDRRIAKIKAKVPAHNAEFKSKEGFDVEGNTWVVLGNTYAIKDELKANGAKFNYILGWHFDHAVENAIKVNIDTICHTDMFGAYTGYNDNANEVIETLKNEATPKTGEYVGTVGDKLNIKVKLTAVHIYYTNFTYRGECNYIFVFTDDSGNLYVWKTASYQDVEEGNNYILSGKIKEHKEYKGNRQNVLTRCKINVA